MPIPFIPCRVTYTGRFPLPVFAPTYLYDCVYAATTAPPWTGFCAQCCHIAGLATTCSSLTLYLRGWCSPDPHLTPDSVSGCTYFLPPPYHSGPLFCTCLYMGRHTAHHHYHCSPTPGRFIRTWVGLGISTDLHCHHSHCFVPYLPLPGIPFISTLFHHTHRPQEENFTPSLDHGIYRYSYLPGCILPGSAPFPCSPTTTHTPVVTHGLPPCVILPHRIPVLAVHVLPCTFALHFCIAFFHCIFHFIFDLNIFALFAFLHFHFSFLFHFCFSFLPCGVGTFCVLPCFYFCLFVFVLHCLEHFVLFACCMRDAKQCMAPDRSVYDNQLPSPSSYLSSSLLSLSLSVSGPCSR